MDDQGRDESVGSELRRRSSPKFAAQQRRRTLIGSSILIVAGVLIVLEGIHAMRTGEWVNLGGHRYGFLAPWWMAVPFGIAAAALGVWTAWPESKTRT
jgi:hypothetical protein